MSKPRPLTPKQELFIIEYAKDFNATQAAIRAGYSGKYIDRTAHQLLERTRDIIESRKAEMKKNGIATLEQTLKLCTAIAFGDPRALFDEIGNVKSPKDLTRRQALLVAGFDVDENFTQVGDKAEHTGYTKKIRLSDRAPYINMLLKFHGAFPAKGQGKDQAPPDRPRFDPSNLSAEEWAQAKVLLEKMQVRTIDHVAS